MLTRSHYVKRLTGLCALTYEITIYTRVCSLHCRRTHIHKAARYCFLMPRDVECAFLCFCCRHICFKCFCVITFCCLFLSVLLPFQTNVNCHGMSVSTSDHTRIFAVGGERGDDQWRRKGPTHHAKGKKNPLNTYVPHLYIHTHLKFLIWHLVYFCLPPQSIFGAFACLFYNIYLRLDVCRAPKIMLCVSSKSHKRSRTLVAHTNRHNRVLCTRLEAHHTRSPRPLRSALVAVRAETEFEFVGGDTPNTVKVNATWHRWSVH